MILYAHVCSLKNLRPNYVNDKNLIGTLDELSKIVEYLKKDFEVKDLGKTKIYLSPELEHKANGIIVHQSTYNKRVLKRFYMDKSHPLSTFLVVWSLEPHKDLFCPNEPHEEILDPEVPYFNAIGVILKPQS